jgi:hypothetical protein
VPDDFLVARNPEPDSTLPYLLRLPLGRDGVVLKAREVWPRTAKVYCHRATAWPPDAEVIERVPVRACVRRGPAIDLVLDRSRENRSQFVFTRIRVGREAIFWQSPRTAKQARPGVRLPTARAAGLAELAIVVDERERYPYRFSHQQVAVRRARLPAGDYGVLDPAGAVLAAVERKSLSDLAGSLLSGRLRYVLAALPRAAVVVEEPYAAVFRFEHARPSTLADALAETQVRWPGVPIVFTGTRPLAEEWTFRFLAAALVELTEVAESAALDATLPPAGPLPPRPPTTAQVRAWALAAGLAVSGRGRLRPEVWAAYTAAMAERERTADRPASQ